MQTILVYNFSYKSLIASKSWHIRFAKIDGFFWIYDGSLLFESEKYNFIWNSIRYLIGVKSDFTYVISHNHAKVKVSLYDSLPLEKTMNFHNFVILIKSVWNQKKKIRIITARIYS